MGKLVIDGNKVYMVDEACMKRKHLTLDDIRKQEAGSGGKANANSQAQNGSQCRCGRQAGNGRRNFRL